MPIITEDMLDPVAPTGGRIITADELDPVEKPLSTGQQAMGFLRSVASGPLLGYGDEVTAALTGLLPGRSYDSELADIRKEKAAYRQDSPVLSTVGEIGGSLALPLGGIAKGATTLGKMGNAALKMGGLGAAQGFGEGEGGFTERAKSGAIGGAVGGVVGGAFAGGADAIRKGLSAAGDDFERMALNIQRSDIKKANKFSRAGDPKGSRLAQALETARDKGLFKGGRSPEALVTRNQQMIESLGDDVQKALGAADNAQTDIFIPKLRNAQKVISDNPYEAEKLTKQLGQRMEILNKEWDGSVSGLNAMKQKLYKIGYNGSTESKALDRAIAKDFKESVEAQARLFLGKEGSKTITATNKAQGDLLTLKDVLKKGADSGEMAGGAAKGLRRMVVSPLGGGAAATLGLLTGNPQLAVPAVIGAAATTRAGQFALSDAARLGARGIGATMNAPAAPTSRIIDALTNLGRSATTEPETQGTEQSPRFQGQGKQLQSRQSLPTAERSQLEADTTLALSSPKGTPSPSGNSSLSPLLDAIRLVESSGGKNLIGPMTKYGQAKGPYQILDSTGKEYHKKLGIQEPYDPFNEEQSRQIAEAIILDYSRKFGSIEKGVLAYHTGPGNVQKGNIGPQGRAYVPKIIKALESLA